MPSAFFLINDLFKHVENVNMFMFADNCVGYHIRVEKTGTLLGMCSRKL